jgi:hypothetical protein
VPEDLLSTFRAVYEQSAVAFNEGDLDKVVGGLPEDFEWHAPSEDMDHAVLRGRAEIKGWFEEFTGVFDQWRIESPEFEQRSESMVLVHYVMRGTSRGARVPVEVHNYEVWEFDGLRPLRARQFLTREKALAATTDD